MWRNTVESVPPKITIRRTRIACWITKARTPAHTLSVNMQYLLLFQCNNGYTKAPQRHVIHPLPLLFIKQCSLRLPKFLSITITVDRWTICVTTICQYLYHISFFFGSVTILATNSNLEISPPSYYFSSVLLLIIYKYLATPLLLLVTAAGKLTLRNFT
jgi:hypothetical protein